MSAVRRRVVVRGRVQGVFFRDSVRKLAESEGVAGWVANREDGAVEAAFEGEPEAVDRMVDFCRRGPASARVGNLDASDEDPVGERGFSVT